MKNIVGWGFDFFWMVEAVRMLLLE